MYDFSFYQACMGGQTQLVGPFGDLQCEFKGMTQPTRVIFHSEYVHLFRFGMWLNYSCLTFP
jgi:hypothetical protein